ncbi:MAG: hypothetical protein L0027_10590 [Candidatus Rokubacteria bacterium]|nr:hypothetical protein [Candidatus Rokubacteria bacterium]
MTHQVPAVLADYVARLVGPLAASTTRKQRIQEELLGHLLALYDLECTHCDDSASAALQAIHRFGPAETLLPELQAAIPPLDRWLSLLSHRKDPFMTRLLLAAGILTVLVGLGFVFPAIALLRTQGEPLNLTALPLIAGTAAATLGAVAFVCGLRRRAPVDTR